MRRFDIALIAILLLGAGFDQAGGWQYFGTPAWEDLRFPTTRLATGASNPPTFTQFRDDGSGSPGVYAYSFADQSNAGNEEQMWGDAQFPHAWKLESDICPHVHYTLEDATACNVRICIEYLRADLSEDFPATTTALCADCASGTSASRHNLCDLGTVSMATFAIVSSMFKFRLYRNSSHANDTCDSKSVFIHEFDIHYQEDTRGSLTETAK